MVCAARGNYSQALTLLKQATDIEDSLISQVFSISSEEQRAAFLTSTVSNLYGYLSLIIRHLQESSAAVQSAFELVLRRKAVGTDVAVAQRHSILAGHYPALRTSLQELTVLQFRIAQKTFEGPGTDGLKADDELLVRLNRQREQLETDLAQDWSSRAFPGTASTEHRSAGSGTTLQEPCWSNSFV